MIKNEQFKSIDQFTRGVPFQSMVSSSLRPPMLQTRSVSLPQRSIDPRAIDISSIKGRFAWEKITPGDTYIPVIFRGATKYFCVKMLQKLLSEYPEDVIRRSSYYQYRKPIDLYVSTTNEIELLNKINAHHAHWEYSRQPFTTVDELVRVSDFLPFYEHLRLYGKSGAMPRISSTGSLRTILPQPQQTMQRVPDFLVNMSNTVSGNLTTPLATTATTSSSTSTPMRSHDSLDSLREPIPSVPRPIISRPPKVNGLQVVTQTTPPHRLSQSQRQISTPPVLKPIPVLPPPPSIEPPVVSSPNNMLNSIYTVPSNQSWPHQALTSTSEQSKPATPVLTISSSSPDASTSSSPTITNDRRLSVSSFEKQIISLSKPPSSPSKSTRLHCGWLQINKLYTPYISTNPLDHHLYKIPISLLTFYDLIKIPSSETNSTETNNSLPVFEQTLVTPQEIELINELCLKQNIKPFSIDTKLISLLTFYQYCSANILFVKELPLNEPKASICKDWSSIVQINGGICRLRNITTLYEQTVPFIGNKLLKNFIISSQYLSSITLTTPTASEIEFLQLILFFSNISINLRNVKLIDIECVRKEYNVDLILLFNDKFPLNVLNYQHQDNRPANLQEQVHQSDSSAATNTFAQSTPPPSPLSSPTNSLHTPSSAQLPLTPSSSSSTTTTTTTTANRFQKTITFHGHTMTAYICSGLGTNSQRECVSVKALCDMLYPNSLISDKLETRMLRLLRFKNINRFRPQNHQTMGLTRLVDIKDVEKYWNYLEKGMRSLYNNDGDINISSEVTSSLLDNKDVKASTSDKIENKLEDDEQNNTSEINKCEKRSIERSVETKEQDDQSVSETVIKRVRSSTEEQTPEPPKSTRSQSIQTIATETKHSDDDDSDNDDDDNDNNNHQIRQKSRPRIKIVKRKIIKKSKKKSMQRENERLSNRSSMTLRKPAAPIKKKIRLTRKRSTPRVRTSKPIIAAWVRKYGIEDCCIRLDLYDPIFETGKD